jgi:hypothetical protein
MLAELSGNKDATHQGLGSEVVLGDFKTGRCARSSLSHYLTRPSPSRTGCPHNTNARTSLLCNYSDTSLILPIHTAATPPTMATPPSAERPKRSTRARRALLLVGQALVFATLLLAGVAALAGSPGGVGGGASLRRPAPRRALLFSLDSLTGGRAAQSPRRWRAEWRRDA